MPPRRPGRAKGFSYVGFARYLVTCCTSHRTPWFTNAETVAEVLAGVRACASTHDFAVIAYCFMPDHVHLLFEAGSERADLPVFIHAMKQRTGFAFKARTGRRLWQPSYHDHILRDDEVTLQVARYVVENPVRAGLVASPQDYPFLGSEVYSVSQLLEAVSDLDELA